MKVAIVHDYLIQDGGAERVVLALHELFPNAPIFTLFHQADKIHPDFQKAKIRPSSLNQLPFARNHYQWYLPFMPHGVESFDLSGFDVVISSASTFAKGVIVAPHALHICYCHTPTRFLWQQRLGYVNDLPQPRLVKQILPYFLHRLRQWDYIAAERPDILLTNSKTSQERIRRYYRREAHIIHPPVDTHLIPLSHTPGSYWLTGGRLVGYKRFDLVVNAFTKLNLPLKIFGTGPENKKLREMAGPTIEFLGPISDKEKPGIYQHSLAFIHPQIEDFGITAIEAMAAGKPVIAFNKGGGAETVIDGETGHLFPVQCWQDIGNAVIRFDASRFSPERIRQHAETFSKETFQKKIKALVEDAYKTHQQKV